MWLWRHCRSLLYYHFITLSIIAFTCLPRLIPITQQAHKQPGFTLVYMTSDYELITWCMAGTTFCLSPSEPTSSAFVFFLSVCFREWEPPTASVCPIHRLPQDKFYFFLLPDHFQFCWTKLSKVFPSQPAPPLPWFSSQPCQSQTLFINCDCPQGLILIQFLPVTPAGASGQVELCWDCATFGSYLTPRQIHF